MHAGGLSRAERQSAGGENIREHQCIIQGPQAVVGPREGPTAPVVPEWPTAKAGSNFTPKKDGQIALKKGETYYVIHDKKAWWVVKNAAGDQGKAPSNYLTKDPTTKPDVDVAASPPSSAPQTPLPQPSPSPAPSPAPALLQKRFTVKGNFTAAKAGQLTITKNQVVSVLDDSKKWWVVLTDSGEQGKVPSNYLKLLEDQAVSPGPALNFNEAAAAVGVAPAMMATAASMVVVHITVGIMAMYLHLQREA